MRRDCQYQKYGTGEQRKKFVGVSLPPELAAKFEQEAERQEISISRLLSEILQKVAA